MIVTRRCTLRNIFSFQFQRAIRAKKSANNNFESCVVSFSLLLCGILRLDEWSNLETDGGIASVADRESVRVARFELHPAFGESSADERPGVARGA